MTDLEHLDELERQADSLLDEEQHAKITDPFARQRQLRCTEILCAVRSGVYPRDEALQLANAILSELEIIDRGDSIQ